MLYAILYEISQFPFSPVMFYLYFHSQSMESRRYIPRRAVLYVPGSDDRKLQKIPSLGADCIVLDCEDGVALSRKVDSHLN